MVAELSKKSPSLPITGKEGQTITKIPKIILMSNESNRLF